MSNKPEQTADTGSGPLFERRYWIDVQHPSRPISELFEQVKNDIPHFSPDLLADFSKAKGTEHQLNVDDEFRIKILGPWNGDVRVSKIGEDFFELVTLENHPEAGRIRFSLKKHPALPDTVRFEIHSWARSRDGLVAFTYDTLGMGKRVQQQTWETFCERVGEASGGLILGPVHVETVKQTDSETHVSRDA
ncbi:protein of unknown function [Hymenobacter gelipurpurascens]|uniref:DUF1990 domain-containing protein n=1 Tax=Hymenobacter gelipurpurascens TaxID=89968 RepID=A0A212TQP7_9BACT|nr:DUF1990 family protein [Hymenobacter gelipurpurascens]SNC68339.1 protein of unknown function [Hymenobacter gelipurpurascens]